MFYVYFGHIILPATLDRLALVLLILQMKKFAPFRELIGGRTVTHTWPIWFHPLSSPPTLQMRAALVFSYPVILDVDLCPTLCSVHTGFWHLLLVLRLQNWEAWGEQLQSGLGHYLFCQVLLRTLECPTPFLFFLLQPQMVMSSLFWLICSVNIITQPLLECQGLGRGFHGCWPLRACVTHLTRVAMWCWSALSC